MKLRRQKLNSVQELPANWSDAQVTADSKIPINSFGFQNAVEASCAIQEQVNGAMVPVYISPYGTLIPGKDVLTPTPTVAVWFQQSVTTGTMISLDTSEAITIDYTNPAPKTCNYSANGIWSMSTGQIIYGKSDQKSKGPHKVLGIGGGLRQAVKA
ncbi:hypothetical protein N7462_009656 [Penicillium macrosclerotiorum]|uniref:uncharacterized protein n=1 Tax=Penicillium macrosclerotiorum TaxID=303699 RepID=UPI0025489EA4|nr:uncharacterized protein N7462_009656 [Penicillium macrosclerotiorum]KAJ5674217.1 hypothetical protein N7462_009656 [Penicillium macrosclerotiorum]